jgi:hypothetical protein
MRIKVLGMKNATLSLLLTTSLLGAPAIVMAQEYQNYTCKDLWKERNSIFKAAGYCFKTNRAQRYFGNAGCLYDNDIDLPLSQRDRFSITEIKRIEQFKGCRG